MTERPAVPGAGPSYIHWVRCQSTPASAAIDASGFSEMTAFARSRLPGPPAFHSTNGSATNTAPARTAIGAAPAKTDCAGPSPNARSSAAAPNDDTAAPATTAAPPTSPGAPATAAAAHAPTNAAAAVMAPRRDASADAAEPAA